MSNRLLFIARLFVATFFTSILGYPQTHLGESLQINTAFDMSNAVVQYCVVNTSPRPIVAYGLMIKAGFGDGSTSSVRVVRDYTPTLSLAGNVVAVDRDTRVGALPINDRDDSKIRLRPAPKKGVPHTISVEPVFAIFDDNSIAGDQAVADTSVFAAHRAVVQLYQAHLLAVGGLASSDQIKTGLGDALQKIEQDLALPVTAGSGGAGADTLIRDARRRLAQHIRETLKIVQDQRLSSGDALSRHVEIITHEILPYQRYS